MNSREKILEAIGRNKPALVPLPEIVVAVESDPGALIPQFIAVLRSIGATVIEADGIQVIRNDWQRAISRGIKVVNTIGSLGPVDEAVNTAAGALVLAAVDRAYIAGILGIAENGAIWLDETSMRNRLLPFICQHLVIVLEARSIVADMHEAYRRIVIDGQGYGVFVAGPSKTADIEQALVIGAHGPRSLEVFIMDG